MIVHVDYILHVSGKTCTFLTLYAFMMWSIVQSFMTLVFLFLFIVAACILELSVSCIFRCCHVHVGPRP